MTFRMVKIDGPECSKCGCRASEVVKRFERFDRMIEVHVCDYCDHRWYHTPSDIEQEEIEPSNSVPYERTHCRECGSTNTIIRSTQKPFRYHLCRNCGKTFTSEEK